MPVPERCECNSTVLAGPGNKSALLKLHSGPSGVFAAWEAGE